MGTGYISPPVVTDTGLSCRALGVLMTVAASWGWAAGSAGTDHAKSVSETAGSPVGNLPSAEKAEELC